MILFISFFEYLKYFLAGNTEALQKLKELNSIYKTFKSSKYRYIQKDKTMTPLFLNKIYAIYTMVNTFKSLLESTLFSSDEKKSQLYLNYLIESYLPPEISSKKDKFSRDYMWQKVMEGDNPTKVIKNIENEFSMYKNYFSRHNMPKFEQEYQLLYKLFNLATFSFDLLISKFDSDFSPTLNNAPNYHPVNGEEILNDLKDLYFLIGSLPPKIDLSNILNKLFLRINEENSKNLTKVAVNAINSLYKIIQDDLSLDKILALCRYISEDVKLKIHIDQKNVSILEKYKKEIEERFIKNKDFVLEKYSEQSLMQDIKSLFKNKELQKIEGYNDDLINALEENNFDPISGAQALKITKTFILDIYEQSIKEPINTLILEGFFVEKEYQTEFSNIFFNVNELKSFILEQEDLLAKSPSYSFKLLQTLMMKNISSNENKIKRCIEQINEKISLINKKCGELFYLFGNKIYEILQDYKSPKPAKINNIKIIKGVQNKEFIAQIVQAYNDIAKYIKIIKNFVSLTTQIKK